MLDRLARMAIAHPRKVVVAGWLTALFGLYAVAVPVDLSFSGLMNRDHPEVARYFEASAKYGLGGLLPVLIEGPEDRLDDAVLAVRLALDEMDEVQSVQVPPPRDYFAPRAAWIVDRRLFDRWVALAGRPPSPEASDALLRELDAEAARLVPEPPPGERLVTVVMARDTFELALDADDFPAIRRAVDETLAPLGVTARFAGMPAIITQEQEATLERLRVLGPLSLILVLALLYFVERRLLVLASIAVPMVLSVGCTLAILGLVEGRLTLMESIFGVIVFGLGVDFAIHLLLRMREERRAGRDFEGGLQRAILGTGRGVVAGGVTTAGAFGILAFAPDPVFQRLGLAGGVGLLLCLAFLLVMLPAQWSWIERRAPGGEDASRPPERTWLGRLAGASARRPGWVWLATVAVLGWAGGELGGLRYETNLERVFSRDIDAVETARRIHEVFGLDPGPWVVPADDLEQARRLTAAFEAEPVFGRVDSAALLLQPDVEERRRILDALAPALARTVREAAMEGDVRALEDALVPFDLLLAAQVVGPPRVDALPEALSERWIGPNGEMLVYAFAAHPSLDSAVAARERRAAQAIDPRATSMNAIYEALIGTDRPWMPPTFACVVLFVVLVVWLDLRSVRLAALALLPVTVASVTTVGSLTAFGFSFNTVTLIAIPVLLGLGVDDGIHVVHRIKEQPDRPISATVGSVAASIGLTTTTTCASIGLLLLTRHPGIESVATLLLVGLPVSLLVTVTLIPATAALLRTVPGSRQALVGGKET